MADGARNGNGRWVKGCPSPNAGGRPRAAMHRLGATVRELITPEQLVTEVASIAVGPYTDPRTKLAAIAWLADRGWGKPIESREIDVLIRRELDDGGDDRLAVELLTNEELASQRLLAERVQQRQLSDGAQDAQFEEMPEGCHDAFCEERGHDALCSVSRREFAR